MIGFESSESNIDDGGEASDSDEERSGMVEGWMDLFYHMYILECYD
jgi:hypothetical protein